MGRHFPSLAVCGPLDSHALQSRRRSLLELMNWPFPVWRKQARPFPPSRRRRRATRVSPDCPIEFLIVASCINIIITAERILPDYYAANNTNKSMRRRRRRRAPSRWQVVLSMEILCSIWRQHPPAEDAY